MKKIHLLILLALPLFAIKSFAQINTTLVVSSTPPSTLSSWSNQRQTVVYLVSGATAFETEYKIKTEIQLSDGTVIGKNDLTRARTYTFSQGNTIYNADDVMPMENMIFLGTYRNSLNKTGKLPSDNYQICVQLVSSKEFAPISNVNCKSFRLAALQLPILMKPYNEEVLNEVQSQTSITFRWTPLVPKPQFVATYKILVFEVLKDQSAMQALRSNMPILSQEVRGTTQYIWQPQGILNLNPSDEQGIIHPKKLVWTIQTFDNEEQPILEGNVNGDGVSEPVFFYIANKKTTTKS
jgi:hypothetical protein